MRLLQDKVVIITGGASGMGRAGARLFADEGARVVVADLNEQKALETEAEITSAGGVCRGVRYDATSSADSKALVDFTLDTFGKLDVAWANAGLPAPFATVETYDEDLMDRLLAVNIKGPWLLAKYSAPALKVTQGSFVITASLSGLKGRANHSGYQAAKGGAVMLTRALAKEFAPFNVRVNSLCPVAADTPMLPQFLDEAGGLMSVEELAAGIPMGRLATAEDVARAALFFASDMSAFVTGINMAVDGGTSA
jgi:3-oxoacyl-[acyl-carrier protein] reductase